MNEDNFPPLPEPEGTFSINDFTTEQMREYGRLVAEECAKLCSTLARRYILNCVDSYDSGCSASAYSCAIAIREEFGVKS